MDDFLTSAFPIATPPRSPNTMASSPIMISPSSSTSSAYTSSPTNSVSSLSSTSSRSSGSLARDWTSRCAFPCWPSGPSLDTFGGFDSAPNSYLSDEDLLPEGASEFLNEAPPPPREASAFLGMDAPFWCPKPLPPLVADKPRKSKRRRSSKKSVKPAGQMTPISESPEHCAD